MAGKSSEEYKLAIKIAGEIEKSFYDSTKMTKKELRDLAKQAAMSATAASTSFPETLKKGLKDAEPAFTGLENAAKTSFKAITAGAAVAGGAVAVIGAQAISVGSEFEAQMKTVQAITNASGNDFDRLKAKAEDLGASTSFTATQAAQAMEYMGMAGWSTEQILAGISGVMQLAAASGEDLSTVSDIVTDDMTAFGISLKDIPTEEAEAKVNHFADVLAAAASSSNTNVSMMGETFKYAGPLAGAMGYSVDDLAVATGLMANSSIKASEAGTTLRNIFTRLAKPTKESKDAIDKLGLSLTNEDGTMRSWMDVMTQMRSGFEGMTEVEKTFYAAELAGQKGMSGLLAIVNASDDDFSSLSNAINNCVGAAERMQDIKLDDLKGDIDIFKSAMDGVSLEIYDQINDPLRETVQIGTELANDVLSNLRESGAIENFFGNAQKKLPTAIRQFREAGDAARDFADPFLRVGGWLLDNPGVIVGSITAVGSALATYKIANGVVEIAGALGSLGPVGWTIMGIGATAGIITGIGTAVKKSAEEAKKANLARHFGDVSLSVKELDRVARQVVRNKNVEKIGTAVEALGKLDGISNQIDDTIEALNESNWRVSVGMQLTDEEQQEYRDQVAQLTQQTSDYISQRQYVVTLSVGTLLSDNLQDNNVVSQLNNFYSGRQQELADLGTKLNEVITDAFTDGLLDIDEVEEISKLQQQMAHIKNALASSDFQAGLDLIGQKYGDNLDADSFQNLQAEIAQQVADSTAQYDEAYKTAMSDYRLMLSEGQWTQAEFDKNAADLNTGYMNQISEMQAKAVKFQMDVIRQAYGDELNDIIPEIQAETQGQLGEMLNNVAYGVEPNVHFDWLPEGIIDVTKNGIDKSTRDIMEDLYEQMAPQVEQMQRAAQQYREAGKAIPESLKEGLSDTAMIGAIGGNEEAMWKVVADAAESPEYHDAINAIKKSGNYIPDQIVDAMTDGQNDIDESIKKSYETSARIFAETYGKGFDVNIPVNPNIVQGAPYSNKYLQSQIRNGHADGGIFDVPHVAWFAEDGPEAAIPIDGSQNAMDLWLKTGELLGVSGLEDSATENIDSVASSQSISITYNPQITITGSNASREDIADVLETEQEKFARMMEQYMKDNNRFKFE